MKVLLHAGLQLDIGQVVENLPLFMGNAETSEPAVASTQAKVVDARILYSVAQLNRAE